MRDALVESEEKRRRLEDVNARFFRESDIVARNAMAAALLEEETLEACSRTRTRTPTITLAPSP